MSRIESGAVDLAIVDVDAAEAIELALGMVELSARKQGIALGREAHEGPSAYVCVPIFRTRLRQVLINLLSNAIKYNHEKGGRVERLQPFHRRRVFAHRDRRYRARHPAGPPAPDIHLVRAPGRRISWAASKAPDSG